MEHRHTDYVYARYFGRISDAIGTLKTCDHGIKAACFACLTIHIQLKLIAGRFEPGNEAAQDPEVMRKARELLSTLEDVCLWPRPLVPPPGVSRRSAFAILQPRIEQEEHFDALCKSIKLYLGQPLFVVEPLQKKCETLWKMMKDPETQQLMIGTEPEDLSKFHKTLFSALESHSVCKSWRCSCEGEKSKPARHPTRIFLREIDKTSARRVMYDVLTASTDHKAWIDMCIRIRRGPSGKKARFSDQEEDSEDEPAQIRNHIDFCYLVHNDECCRRSLELELKALMHNPDADECLQHPVAEGKGLSLADVLEKYSLSVSDKITLAYTVAFAFWQFYNTQSMASAWNSQTIWFMFERDPPQNKKCLPRKAYISFHPDTISSQNYDQEYMDRSPIRTLLHRCPRIQALAVILLEISLGKPFSSRSSNLNIGYELNSRYQQMLTTLEELKSFEWKDFSHGDRFVVAVDNCLWSKELSGKSKVPSNEEPHTFRRRILFEKVVLPLQSLNDNLPKRGLKAVSYLSPKQERQEENTGHTTLHPTISQRSTWISNSSLSRSGAHDGLPSRDSIKIAIICALPIEAEAVEALLDYKWNGRPNIPGDRNIYTVGSIGQYNVVIAYLHNMGVSSAAAAAVDCRRSFRKVEIALVVGICGALPIIPGTKTPIYLGDVIISDGIIPYRNVRIFTNQSIQRNALHDMMAKPKRHIMALLAKLRVKSSSEALEEETRKNLEALGASDPAMRYPGIQADRLFEADYEHVGSKEKCHRGGLCDDRRITRYRRGDIANPKIHIGTMASGDALMKSARERDRIAQESKIIGFEMEANGVWDEMPSLVIKAVNDYADSHKNDIWQRYAAASAAAAMKAFLSHWTPEDLLDETQEQGWLDI
ncbi:hypothetical protein S7711_01600 [Stachybotrys chartarum IBT 7711]|uniref:Uncharacterized protein n=1 Tax=Stachybotrys chartarum (strain CBS 109288 / IBT 7711) TaxID=1280523 RepID=A0A084BC71_STACB|nr:hypothetical protein S7711_01600 [Stachybotrys chartarum IBT 7711]